MRIYNALLSLECNGNNCTLAHNSHNTSLNCKTNPAATCVVHHAHDYITVVT